MRGIGTALLGLALLGCAGESVPDAPQRQRLADEPVGVLSGPSASPAETVFDERFGTEFRDGVPDGWRLATDPNRPLDFEPGVLSVTRTVEGTNGAGAAVLSGRRGALYRVVEVEPNTPYRFQARVRCEGLVPESEPFFGAAPWIAELLGEVHGPPDLGDGLDGLVHTRHQFDSAIGSEDWRSYSATFVTGPETGALLVSCLLGFQGDVLEGSVAFRDLRLERLSEPELWGELAAEEIRILSETEPDLSGWRAKRRVRAWLGGEWRPAILLMPGETLTLRVRVPRSGAILETGLGPWRPAYLGVLRARGGRDLRMSVEHGGKAIVHRDVHPPEHAVEARWLDASADLSDAAGEEVTLRFGVEGDLPGVFGAPTLRATGSQGDLPMNLVLVSIDTLRADHVGCYGGGAATPRLDALAAQGILFEEVQSSAPYTLPSHASQFSGQVPTVHGVTRGGRVLTPRRSPVLARILAEAGYRTEAMTAGGFLNADFGFDQGFDRFSTVDPIRDPDSRHLAVLADRDPTRFDRALFGEYGPERIDAFLEEHRDEAFFLFLHTFAVHDYDPPPAWRTCGQRGCTATRDDYREYHLGIAHPWTPQPVSDADRAHLGHLYDEALSFVDDSLGHVLERLDELGLADRTVVAVTSDHGEEMFERGFVQHGKTLYREVVRVPWILSVPGKSPLVIETPAAGIDLAPTLLGALGLPGDPRMQGRDLLGSDAGTSERWCEVDDGYVHRYGLTDDQAGFVLIHSPEDPEVFFPPSVNWELYDLTRDPGERVNRVDSAPEVLGRLRDRLLELRGDYAELAEELGSAGRGEVQEGTRVELEELGYTGK
ncbi:MAG TPA: hypothetical protein ENJ09_08740 [Planctomycetes bacterium]|nr:hypothetical protein [Planctomycetota bacterium]